MADIIMQSTRGLLSWEPWVRRWLEVHDRGTITAALAADPHLRRLYDRVVERVAPDPAHDLSHLWRVAEWTLRLGGRRIVAREAIAAAFLHDFINRPKHSRTRARASSDSAEAVGPLLRGAGFNEPAISRIRGAIRDHSLSRGARPSEHLAQALQDADRLDAVGAIGILRAAAVGGVMGSHALDLEDPWARVRQLDDRQFVLDHFFTKLLRLPDLMLTPGGRAEARRRGARMRRFLTEVGLETGHRWPPSGRAPSRPKRGGAS